jgi:hypothetical protein
VLRLCRLVGRCARTSDGYRALEHVHSRQAASAHTLVHVRLELSCEETTRPGRLGMLAICVPLYHRDGIAAAGQDLSSVPGTARTSTHSLPWPAAPSFTLDAPRLSVGLHTSARLQDNAATLSHTANPLARSDRQADLSSAACTGLLRRRPSLSTSARRVQSKTV